VTYREALRRALDEELDRDERVFLMGEEIGRFEGSYKVTAGLWAKYGPKRVRETPISEEGFVGAGIGAAMLGLRPVVEIMTINFIMVAQDMVVNHAAKIRYMFGGKVGVPMVIRTPGGAGAQLTAQHSQSLEVWFAHVPGLKVVAPSSPRDAYGLRFKLSRKLPACPGSHEQLLAHCRALLAVHETGGGSVCRAHPQVFALVASGELHASALSLLKKHLTSLPRRSWH